MFKYFNIIYDVFFVLIDLECWGLLILIWGYWIWVGIWISFLWILKILLWL